MATTSQLVRAATLEELESLGRKVIHLNGNTVVLFTYEGQVYAVDNRCPHMGFPLHRGSVRDGILTCHWHHARFDLATGGTFDQFADDVRSYPVELRDSEIWVDIAPRRDTNEHQKDRLRDGLQHQIPLVVAKSVVHLLEAGQDPAEAFRIGLDFGTRFRATGWGQGLTMLTCFMNLLPQLNPEDRQRALYKGLTAVAVETMGQAPRFQIRPLPGSTSDLETLTRWFRQFVEVRDDEGAERCIVSAVQTGADHREISKMMFAAATDHRYIQIGHVVDFTNKAFEALAWAGWEYAEQVLSSLAPAYASASRMEESNAWRRPVDLVEILEDTFDQLPSILEKVERPEEWSGRDELTPILLGEDPQAIASALISALQEGATTVDLAVAVSYAAALRIAQFHTSNEFSDWDTALHTFTFANAVEQGLRRNASPELLRGVFDAAMSIYLDRFLNVPATRLPQRASSESQGVALLEQLADLLNKQQQVNQAGELVAAYFGAENDQALGLATIGKLLVREDRDFHTIQTVEAAIKQFQGLRSEAGVHVLVAAGRYLAAHSPTVRSQEQTFHIAQRLHRGDRLYEEDD